jgi:hypothetical protein
LGVVTKEFRQELFEKMNGVLLSKHKVFGWKSLASSACVHSGSKKVNLAKSLKSGLSNLSFEA